MLQKLRTSLTSQAVAMAFILGTVPVAVVGTFAYIYSNESFTESLSATERQLVTESSKEVNLFMEDRLKDMKMMSRLDIFTDPQLRAAATKEEKVRALNRMKEIYEVYDSIAVFDTQGNVIAQTEGKPLGNHLNRSYIQEAIKADGAILSQPLISSSTGSFNVYAASPMKGKETGKTIGYIRASIPVENLANLLQSDDLGRAEFFLVDNQGTVFLTPEGIQATKVSSSGKAVGDEDVEALKINEIFPGVEKFETAETAVSGMLTNAQTNKEEFVAYVDSNNLQGFHDLGWKTLIAHEKDEVFGAELRLRWTILLGTVLTGALATIIGTTLIRRTSKSLLSIADRVAISSDEITSTVTQQEATVNNQANSVTQTTSTIDRLGSVSLQSAEKAESSNSGALKALELAQEGSQSVQEAIVGINTLKEQVNAIAEQIMRLSEQTGQIVNISQLVGDIANQTNMLALNAAVEAVRAGEQGKGFTVVAGEIRKLADESKKSAEKINAVANTIQASMNSTVMVTDEGTKKATESISLAERMASAFAGVKEALDSVAMNSQQISQGSKEQAVTVQEVISAMNEVNFGAQETASGIDQVKHTLQQLNEAAKQLKAIV